MWISHFGLSLQTWARPTRTCISVFENEFLFSASHYFQNLTIGIAKWIATKMEYFINYFN